MRPSFFPLAAALALALAVTLPTSAQGAVTAQTLVYAEYSAEDGETGWFEQTGPGSWVEYKTDGWRQHASFQETGRTASTVLLFDGDRRIEVELNLADDAVYTGGSRSNFPRMYGYALETIASRERAVVAPGTYRLTNSFLGTGRSLDTYSGETNEPFMGETGNYSGQFWTFSALGDGTYRMTNSFLGDARSLDTYSDGENKPFMGETGNYSGQLWTLAPIGEGYFRLTNSFLGTGRSLDTYSGETNEPFMGETGNYTGQRWRLQRTGR